MSTTLAGIKARNVGQQNGSGRVVTGVELRYLLTTQLFEHGQARVADLVNALAAQGFAIAGRPSKAVSDALRWERERKRVRKFGRGHYGPGWMPRGTEHRIHARVQALRDEAAGRMSLSAGHPPDSDIP